MLANKTACAVLGLLTIEPMSGYEMRSVMQKSICHFWSESNGQLYPTISQLLENGLITLNREHNGKRSKSVYSITDAGRTELRRWIASTTTHKNVHRDEELLKLFFGGNDSANKSILLLKQRAARLTQQLNEYIALREEIANLKNSPHHVYWTLALNNGIAMAEAEIAWSQQSIATLEQNDQLDRSGRT